MAISAKEKAKDMLLNYLGNPDNNFEKRAYLSTHVLGYKNENQINKIFTPNEMTEIEKEALEIRRKKYSSHISEVDRALLTRAKKGDARAAKLVYQRFEGWSEKQIREHEGSITLTHEDALSELE